MGGACLLSDWLLQTTHTLITKTKSTHTKYKSRNTVLLNIYLSKVVGCKSYPAKCSHCTVLPTVQQCCVLSTDIHCWDQRTHNTHSCSDKYKYKETYTIQLIHKIILQAHVEFCMMSHPIKLFWTVWLNIGFGKAIMFFTTLMLMDYNSYMNCFETLEYEEHFVTIQTKRLIETLLSQKLLVLDQLFGQENVWARNTRMLSAYVSSLCCGKNTATRNTQGRAVMLKYKTSYFHFLS